MQLQTGRASAGGCTAKLRVLYFKQITPKALGYEAEGIELGHVIRTWRFDDQYTVFKCSRCNPTADQGLQTQPAAAVAASVG